MVNSRVSGSFALSSPMRLKQRKKNMFQRRISLPKKKTLRVTWSTTQHHDRTLRIINLPNPKLFFACQLDMEGDPFAPYELKINGFNLTNTKPIREIRGRDPSMFPCFFSLPAFTLLAFIFLTPSFSTLCSNVVSL